MDSHSLAGHSCPPCDRVPFTLLKCSLSDMWLRKNLESCTKPLQALASPFLLKSQQDEHLEIFGQRQKFFHSSTVSSLHTHICSPKHIYTPSQSYFPPNVLSTLSRAPACIHIYISPYCFIGVDQRRSCTPTKTITTQRSSPKQKQKEKKFKRQ